MSQCQSAETKQTMATSQNISKLLKEGWLNKLWFINTQKYYAAVKMIRIAFYVLKQRYDKIILNREEKKARCISMCVMWIHCKREVKGEGVT